jgi:hypothetical protein
MNTPKGNTLDRLADLYYIIDYAVNVYDTAFISTNYIHLAQVSFQHYVDERLSAAPDEKPEGLENALNNLDVAIERSDSPPLARDGGRGQGENRRARRRQN